MLASLVLAPASGAFVSLAQATLIDVGGAGPERSMARWVAAGSVGVVAGPLALSVALAAGLGWRETFLGLAATGGLLVLGARRVPFGAGNGSLRDGVRGALGALRRREVLRWLVLKDVTDLMGDVLFGFLALYFVDVVGVSPAQAALAVAVWTAGGLAGDFALLVILRRVSGSTHLRVTAAVALVVFPAFLLAPGLWPKIVLAGVLGASAPAGTRSRRRRSSRSFRAEAAPPSRSAICRACRRACSRSPLACSPRQFDLGNALWVALASPLALLALVPRDRRGA